MRTIWNRINSKSDIDNLLTVFGDFHDGCLREAHVWTEHWVTSGFPHALHRRVRYPDLPLGATAVRNPSAVELLFEQVVTFHLQPRPHNYDSIIFEATMLQDGDTFYWADVGGWSQTANNCDEATWIAAKKIAWRDADAIGWGLTFVMVYRDLLNDRIRVTPQLTF